MYFWITAVVIILAGGMKRLISDDNTLDINVHDTYYVIDNLYVIILLAVIYFILGVAYWVPYKAGILLNKKLTKLHTVITVLTVPEYYILLAYANYVINNPFGKNYEALNIGILLISFTVLLIQPLYLINVIISLIKQKKA